jgi:Rrf2 family transcriptional regulator, nitric oxide-sensitive transcriptional repressor
MRLALQTDYALRILMFLASKKGRQRATIAAVAGFFRISEAHVAKVVNQLARLGFVRSVRGAGGGIELGQDAARIRLGEVLMAFEGNMHLLECVGTENVCVIQQHCKLKNVLAEAERLQFEYLNEVRLTDVVPV